MKFCFSQFIYRIIVIGVVISGGYINAAAVPPPGAIVSQGRGETRIENLIECPGSRISRVGQVIAQNGTEWVVPANTNFAKGPKAPDLYNDCTRIRYDSLADLNLDDIPIIELDSDGEIITGYLFADNYFELYVNGVLIGVDAVTFTPFNSSIVRFKVKKPITYAVKLVDWEENLGLGTESNWSNSYHPGDGGFVAHFSDGTMTDESWKAQVFYIAPLEDPGLVTETRGVRDSSKADDRRPGCDEQCYALHYSVPKEWQMPHFDDTDWPQAFVYSNDTVGVRNKRAYMNFIDQFLGAGAKFIWSSNLVLDNLVLVRKTVQ